MKSRSYISKLIVFMGALSFLVACSDENSQSGEKAQERKSVFLSVSHIDADSSSITRTTLTPSKDASGNDVLADEWAKGDKVFVYNLTKPANNNESLLAEKSGVNSTFSGYATCVVDDKLALFYPYITSINKVTGVYDTYNDTLTLNISQQDGTLKLIQERYDFCEAHATVTGLSGFNAVAEYGDMKNLMSVAKFTFSCNGSALSNITSVKVTGNDNLYMQRVYSLRTEDYVEGGDYIPTTGITFKFDEGVSEFYQVFFPTTVSLQFTIAADGKNYVGHLLGKMEAGYFYNTVVYCTENSLIGNVKTVSDKAGQLWAFGNLYYEGGAFHTFEDYQFRCYGPKGHLINGSAAIGATGYLIKTDLFNFGDVGTPLADGVLGFYNDNYVKPLGDYESGLYYHSGAAATTKQDYGICGDKRYDICTRALGANWRLPTYKEIQKVITYGGNGGGYSQYFYSTPENVTAGSWTGGLFLPPAGVRTSSTYVANSSVTTVSTGCSWKVNGFYGYDYPNSPSWASSSTSNNVWKDVEGKSWGYGGRWGWWHWQNGYNLFAGYYLTGSIYDSANFWMLYFHWDGYRVLTNLHRQYGGSVRCRYVAD